MARWPIRGKLLFGLMLVLLMLGILDAGSIYGLRSYRKIIKICQKRTEELSYVTALWSTVQALEDSAPEEPGFQPQARAPRDEFARRIAHASAALKDYKDKVIHNAERDRDPNPRDEGDTIERMRTHLERLRRLAAQAPPEWAALEDPKVEAELTPLKERVNYLPEYLQTDLEYVLVHANGAYLRSLWLTAGTSLLVVLLLIAVVWMFYTWVFRPIRKLHHGSRRVAAGNFGYRIRLDSHDEMAELAAAFNHMTSRFQRIYQDLDRQVKDRSRQLIRSERLAGVGYLAAGVAHEINNPLMSIAMASESLQRRLHDTLASNGTDEANVANQYLRMIHEEAFRCKAITERLLDFSRMGDLQRQPTDLVQLVEDVVEMVRHLGKYRGKQVVFEPHAQLVAPVNPQEIKQVVLNLVTNALESMDDEGLLRIEVAGADGMAELVFTDNGCGMTEEVLENVFEPFFTRRRDGQGTGLGLSITHRIINQHGGEIEVASRGPGKGSTFTVRLPRTVIDKPKQEVHAHALA